MIETVRSWEPYEPFLHQYAAEDPTVAGEEQLLADTARVFAAAGSLCFCAVEETETAGLFAFVPAEEGYLVTQLWLTRSEGAGREMLAHFWEDNKVHGVEFTFRPQNTLLRKLLMEAGATVFPVQRDMRLTGPAPAMDTAGIVPLRAGYEGGYFALHRAADPEGETYWTGEMVAADREGFGVLLAVEGGVPVGYLDLSLGEAGNNVGDLFVAPDHRRKGWGRKLLTEAVRRTLPRPLTLQVDGDNAAARALYEAMGFRYVPGSERVDAIWRIPR